MRIVFPNKEILEFDRLQEFICQSKRKGWASGSEPTKVEDREVYINFEGPLYYLDEYFGEGAFMGRESAYFHGKRIWAMNYSDRFQNPRQIPQDQVKDFKKDAFRYLKVMLMKVPSRFPFRGLIEPLEMIPEETKFGIIEYKHEVKTTFSDPLREFKGDEGLELSVGEDKPERFFNFTYHGRLLVPDTYLA